VLGHITVLVAFTAEVLIWFDRPDLVGASPRMGQFLLSGGWGIYAIGLLLAGLLGKARTPRMLGLVLFGLAAVKVCVFDVSHLRDWMRIGAFCLLGVLMLAGSWLYYRYRETLRREFLGIESKQE
jgi:uncharacterized membrane protein